LGCAFFPETEQADSPKSSSAELWQVMVTGGKKVTTKKEHMNAGADSAWI
jgi:hypothetical protein